MNEWINEIMSVEDCLGFYEQGYRFEINDGMLIGFEKEEENDAETN